MSENNVLMRFFSNPIVGLSGSVASILGLILAVIFFLEAKANRELTFYVHPVRTTIVKMGQASRLSVSFDGRDIKKDITAVQIALWSKGKQSIKNDEVLAPIFFYSSDKSPIKEAKILNSNREISGIILNTDDLDNGKVGVSWKILENGDGCSIQFIYEGTPETQFEISGIIEGQKNIAEFKKPIKLKTLQEQYESRKSFGITSIIILGGIILSCYIIIKEIRIAFRKGARELLMIKSIKNILAALLLLYFGIDYFIYVLERGSGPPFAF